MNKLAKQAFTLIELLVVIAIIGILSGLIVVSMGGMTDKANLAKVQVFSSSLRNSLMADLISEWKFDEVSGQTMVDSWSGANNAILGGTVDVNAYDPTITTSDCISGNCLSFDGTDDYIDCGNGANLNPKSIVIEMWLYLSANPDCDANNNWRSLLRKGSAAGTANGYDIVIEQARYFSWDIGTTAGSSRWIPASIQIPYTQWVHYVFSYDSVSGRMRAYQNGKAAGYNDIAANPIASNNLNLYISNNSGMACPIGTGAFPGKLDNIRIYGAPISASQIKEHYYTGLMNLLISKQISYKEYSEKTNLIANNE